MSAVLVAGPAFAATRAAPTPAGPADSADTLPVDAAAARRRAERADYQLLYRYPDEATYRKLMAGDLAVVIGHLGGANARLAEVVAQRKPLDQQAAFYKDKPMPPALQARIDESEASFKALADVFRGLEQDVALIVDKYERPRERLEKLWAGAPLGSMGLYDPAAAAPTPK